MMNTGQLEVNFDVDEQSCKSFGISIESEKVVKMQQGEMVQVNIQFSTTKKDKVGKRNMVVPIAVKGGAI